MENILVVILVGISLSMDAFSFAIIYGTYGMDKRNVINLSFIVGLFHFFMPLLGFLFSNVIMRYFVLNINLVVGIIFFIIGISMIISIFRDDDIQILISMIGFLLFGFSVSIDSFTTGIGLFLISRNYLMVSCIFMIISGTLTYIGLSFGNFFSKKFGKSSNIFGGVVMTILSLYYIFIK